MAPIPVEQLSNGRCSIVNTNNTGSANDSGIYAGIGIPNPDALQEFKIQTSTYDASYGAHPGGTSMS